MSNPPYQPYFNHWRITANPKKTSAILFTNKTTTNRNKIRINNTLVNWSNPLMYLGIHIYNKLQFRKYVNITINKTKATGDIIFPLKNKIPLYHFIRNYIYNIYR